MIAVSGLASSADHQRTRRPVSPDISTSRSTTPACSPRSTPSGVEGGRGGRLEEVHELAIFRKVAREPFRNWRGFRKVPLPSRAFPTARIRLQRGRRTPTRRRWRPRARRRTISDGRRGTKPCKLNTTTWPSPTITKTANQLLSALKPSDFSQVARKLTRVKLRPKQVIYKPNAPLDYIYFPEDTVLCLLTLMSNSNCIEAATVSREGACVDFVECRCAEHPLRNHSRARGHGADALG